MVLQKDVVLHTKEQVAKAVVAAKDATTAQNIAKNDAMLPVTTTANRLAIPTVSLSATLTVSQLGGMTIAMITTAAMITTVTSLPETIHIVMNLHVVITAVAVLPATATGRGRPPDETRVTRRLLPVVDLVSEVPHQHHTTLSEEEEEDIEVAIPATNRRETHDRCLRRAVGGSTLLVGLRPLAGEMDGRYIIS